MGFSGLEREASSIAAKTAEFHQKALCRRFNTLMDANGTPPPPGNGNSRDEPGHQRISFE
jgi:hypothetical protein